MENASPRHYDILLEPDLNVYKFAGQERIEVEAEKPVKKLVLNAAELIINSCKVSVKGMEIPSSFSLDAKGEELVIELNEKIKGRAEVFIEFVGTLNDKLLGFYRSEYVDAKGEKKTLATTQFEAADARRAFPCWDSPVEKATFDISLLVDSGLEAVSNMPVREKKKSKGKTLFRFQRSPVMSTYLVYMGVGEFEYLEGKSGRTQMRVITTKGNKQRGQIALEYGSKLLGYYENYFGITYPLPKLDLIAIPDFASGAMENWGAITFREAALLYDPKTSSTGTKQTIAEIISHEIAHQWFGNLVTMEWWNDLWLNESFATFMATKALHHFHPEWDLWDQFLETSRNEAMNLDALKTSHPIEVEVKEPSEIREIFDDISYDKGGCVLYMLEDFISEDNFRAGLKSYLTKHKYANAKTDDLWDALAAASKKPVKDLMNGWIRQVGYPIVEADVSGFDVKLRQRRFLLEKGKDSAGRWMIPVTIRTPDKFFSTLMTGASEKFSLENVHDWVKLNYGQRGFYRVKYGKSSLENLKPLIAEKKISNEDRWGISNDLFALTLAGEESLKSFLEFAESYANEDDYMVSVDIADSLYFSYLICSDETFAPEIAGRARKFFRKALDRLGWDAKPGEKHTDTLFRGFVINALGKLGDKEVMDEANRRFDLFLENPDSLVPDLRLPVYSLVAWGGDSMTYQRLYEQFRKAKTQEEKLRFQASLSSFQDEKLLKDSLEFSLSKEVKLQDLYINIIKVSVNPKGKKLVWPWLKDNWKDIAARFGNQGNPLLNRIVATLSIVSDGDKAKEIENFFKRNRVPGTEMKLAQTLERIRINSGFVERTRKEFAAK